MTSFHFTLRTPLETVLKVDAQSVTLDTETGRMVVLPGHASLTGTLTFSKVTVVYDNKTDFFYVKNGTLFIGRQQGSVELLCMTCDLEKEMNRASVEQYLALVKEKLQNKESLGDYQLKFLEREKFALEQQVKVVK